MRPIKQLVQRFKLFLSQRRAAVVRGVEWLLSRLEPTNRTAVWLKRLAWLGPILLGAWIGLESLHLPGGAIAGAMFGALAGGLAVLLAYLALSLLAGPVSRLFQSLDRIWTRAGLAAAIAAVLLVSPLGLPSLPAVLAGVLVVGAFSLVGAGIGLLTRKRRRPLAGSACLIPGVVVIVFMVTWMHGGEGNEDPVASLVPDRNAPAGQWAGLLQPGVHEVGFLAYGSGSDQRRAEYGLEAAWTSESVDGGEILSRPNGFGLKLRERWWGFGLDELPLNGRVWYPVGAPGPLPLVLVVHGNHDMMHFSDPGYAWIGEHLASRGHIVVSVDQNFLNGGVFGDLDRENAARGWLMLEHLAAWREWQQSPGHELHEKADLDNVVLIGHSRGGEAVALAAAFNRLQHFPENHRVSFDYGFGIQGVAAIAPIDGQFWVSDKPTPLEDASYFVIHGGMDGDVYYFAGDRQWRRAALRADGGRFAASLYVHHANHGQFNTVWGDNDTGSLAGRFLNRTWMMNGEDQRRVGRLYLTAFVESALARATVVPDVFCRPGAAGQALPDTIYVARCDDGRRLVLADFEQRLDITRGNLPGVRLAGRDLDMWEERDVGFRSTTSRRQTGAFLGWHTGEEPGRAPMFAVTLDEQSRNRLDLSASSVLWLDLAHADQDPPERRDDGNRGADGELDPEASGLEIPDPADNGNGLRPALSIEVELVDVYGVRSRRALKQFGRLLPPLPVRHTRLDVVNRERYRSATEPVLASMAVELEDFAADGVAVDELEAMNLHFDNAAPGVLIIERITVQP